MLGASNLKFSTLFDLEKVAHNVRLDSFCTITQSLEKKIGIKIKWILSNGDVWIYETPASPKHELVVSALQDALHPILNHIAIRSGQMTCYGATWSQSADLSYIPDNLPSPDPNADPQTGCHYPRLVVEVQKI